MKNIYYLVGIISIILAGVFLFNLSKPNNSGFEVYSQDVVLSIQDYNYYPNIIHAKVNQPLKIRLDDSVTGCYTIFVVKDFGVTKFFANTSDVLEFTPNKTGSFKFACSMGMGQGTLIIE